MTDLKLHYLHDIPDSIMIYYTGKFLSPRLSSYKGVFTNDVIILERRKRGRKITGCGRGVGQKMMSLSYIISGKNYKQFGF